LILTLIFEKEAEVMEATRVTVDEVKERMNRGEPFAFVDSRNPKAWEESDVKLPGAIHIPSNQVEQHLSEIPKDRAVVTYCT
jgi:rhodanese-related sulfurtransferase